MPVLGRGIKRIIYIHIRPLNRCDSMYVRPPWPPRFSVSPTHDNATGHHSATEHDHNHDAFPS